MRRQHVRLMFASLGIIATLVIALQTKGLLAGSGREAISSGNQSGNPSANSNSINAIASSNPAAIPNSIPGHVYYCSDGDTCRIKVSGVIWMNVRLFGIDAPETSKERLKKKGQAMGLDAKEFINNKVQGKDVLVVQADLDPYNRPVVEIFLGPENINLTMVEQGYAEVYRGKSKRLDRQPYEEAEAKAKTNKLGIWSQGNYQSPAAFRRQQKFGTQ